MEQENSRHGRDQESRTSSEMPGFGKTLRILLAEDDIAVAKGFQIVLKQAGYEVTGIAHDGVEAVDMATIDRPDLILMDIKMPRMDGLEAAKKVNEGRENNFIPIVLVTAYTEKNLIERAKLNGVLGYLVKPVHVDDLVPAVELAHSAAQKIHALEGVVDNLNEELESRKLVERAKGILMKRLGVDEESALRMMQKESRRQRIKLKELARAIISSNSFMS